MPITDEQRQEVNTRRANGESLDDIVANTGVKYSTVRWILSQSGVRLSKEQRGSGLSKAGKKRGLDRLLKERGVNTWDEAMDQVALEKEGKRIGTYVNSRTPVEFECKRFHRFGVRPSNLFFSGQWCGECAPIERRLPFEEWQKRAAAHGGVILSDYEGQDVKHLCECVKKHQFFMPLRDIKDHWCPVCAENAHSTPESQVGLMKSRGWELLEPARTVMEKATIKCDKGHVFKMRPNNVQQGQNCPIEAAGCRTSKGQAEFFEYIKSVDERAVSSDRSVISPLELDGYSPNRRAGFEYDGLLWHSSFVAKIGEKPYQPLKHNKKFFRCLEADISLLAIFEDEWFDPEKQLLIKAMIRWRLGKFTGTRLHARKLEVRKLHKNKEFAEFFKRNHIDGTATAQFAYGLFHEGKMIQCMSFRRDRKKRLEIARLAADYDYSVPGGAGRLIAAVRKDTKEAIFTYSNNRLSVGNTYQKLGFKLVQENPPSYYYTDGKVRIWRFKCRRRNEPEILAQFPTEKAQALGGVFSKMYLGDDRSLYQIHDYGHRAWLLE
jgi:hypothetical protein